MQSLLNEFNAAVPKIDERDYKHFTEWYDASLDAHYWFSIPQVTPEQAALLLCEFNPREQTFQDALASRKPDIPETALINLFDWFTAAAGDKRCYRRLHEWLDIALNNSLPVHPWSARYVKLADASRPKQNDGTLKPEQRSRAQDAAILGEIRRLGHNPLAIPKHVPGKPGLKAQVKAGLERANSQFPKGSTVFKHAWDRLRSSGDITDE